MIKNLRLALNRYASVPATLRSVPTINAAVGDVEVNLAHLYHHYFLDSFDMVPPIPDAAHFEHTQFLLPTPEFRFQGNGLGVAPAIRRHRSNELGQAFCRWFLYEHLDVSYFAHIERLLDRQLKRPFLGCSLDRINSGDTPDYLCASASNSVCLAEAKGRYSAISFKNKEFSEWRNQFYRVAFNDSSGISRRLKGHIVATRFATEVDSEKLKSTIYAEDPSSPGERDLDGEASTALATITRAAHFSNIAQKLRQPILASALLNGVRMPEELAVSGIAWQVLVGPLAGRRFVGGYYAAGRDRASFHIANDRFVYDRPDPLRLDSLGPTFFGLEENILRQVVRIARSPPAESFPIEAFRETEFFYSGFSVLRDGSAVAPLEFFVPVEQVTL